MIPNFTQLIFVGIGGFLGANARYILSAWIAVRMEQLIGKEFPYGTLFVNATGSFLLAIFGVWVTKQTNWPEHMRLLVGTGFFGAYTTFSTYANESMILLKSENWPIGLGNIIANNVICLFGVVLGLWLARQL